MKVCQCAVLGLALVIASAAQASAALMSAGSETQLESWLGGSDLVFTNIYTKGTGDTSIDFHAAVDGKGPTVTLMEVSWDGSSGYAVVPPSVIGGYNPQSWDSLGTHYTTPNSERTAFIFNLTTSTIQTQKLDGAGAYGWLGEYQTLNLTNYGPTFGRPGAGADLSVSTDLSNISNMFQYAYGNPDSYGGINIVRTVFFITGTSSVQQDLVVGALEVYTFAPADDVADVPAPASLILWGMGGGLAFLGKKLRRGRKTELAA